MEIKIRKAKPEDAQNISFLIKDSMGFDNPPEIIAYNIERMKFNEKDYIIVAMHEEELVGIAHAENYDSIYSPPLKDLMTLAVKPEYQHMKIGTLLMNEIEKWAVETGRAGVRVLSGTDFSDAHKFYSYLGYEVNKHQINFIKYF